LGKFIFDQYFSKETMEGLTLGIELEMKDGVLKETYQFYPIEIDGVQPKLGSLEMTREMLSDLAETCVGMDELCEGIRKGEFVLQ